MKQVAVSGGELAVWDEGAGAPLLLVHGFPLDHSMWSGQFASLAEAYRVIAPDLRGFGNSCAAPEVLTMEQMADDLAAVLEGLEISEPVTLCGLSMGGYVAWQFWRKYPGRLSRLILCDTKAAGDSEEAVANRMRMAEHVVDHGLEYVAEAMLPKLFAAGAAQEQPEIIDAVRATIIRTARQTIAAAQRGMAERPDVTAWLPEINLPSLVVVGTEDQICPPDEMRAMATALPQATFVEIPAAGHMAPLENPQLVNAAIRDFLNG